VIDRKVCECQRDNYKGEIYENTASFPDSFSDDHGFSTRPNLSTWPTVRSWAKLVRFGLTCHQAVPPEPAAPCLVGVLGAYIGALEVFSQQSGPSTNSQAQLLWPQLSEPFLDQVSLDIETF
jgi:hypothetical protein